MGKEPKRTAEGDDHEQDRTTPEPPQRDAESPEEDDAVSGVSRETYEEAVEQAVKDVHG